ncbi:hypothetical protein BDZ89DRAFT_1061413 [Hymenopellis radicata]|nr:hypothetical protein BDZ89DRAFT_1061413 [Hymenopellis radicata]
MAVGDVEKGFGSIASSDCLVLSFAVTMLAVVIGGVCCLVGGANGYVNDPRFSAPILSSFVVGIVGAMVILIPVLHLHRHEGGYGPSGKSEILR